MSRENANTKPITWPSHLYRLIELGEGPPGQLGGLRPTSGAARLLSRRLSSLPPHDPRYRYRRHVAAQAGGPRRDLEHGRDRRGDRRGLVLAFRRARTERSSQASRSRRAGAGTSTGRAERHADHPRLDDLMTAPSERRNGQAPFRRFGLGFQYQPAEAPVVMTFTSVVEKRGELRAEIHVQAPAVAAICFGATSTCSASPRSRGLVKDLERCGRRRQLPLARDHRERHRVDHPGGQDRPAAGDVPGRARASARHPLAL